jgi:phenylpropionate dioxygenase-like ring-hydroxylating dioxygenase large terminal subunit
LSPTGRIIQDRALTDEWHVVAASDEVREDSIFSATLMGEDLAIWRCDGEVLVWQDLCQHRGTRLTLGKVQERQVVCPYHGWTYDRTGQCVKMPAHPEQAPPANAKVQTYRTKEKYGLVWAALGAPARGVPAFPELDDPSFRKITVGPYHVRASGPRIIENFVDVAHLAILHPGLLADGGHPEIYDYEVNIGPDGISTGDVRIWSPATPEGKAGETTWRYRIPTPLVASAARDDAGQRFLVVEFVTPVSEQESVVRFLVAMNFAQDTPDQLIREVEDTIVKQDMRIVESQRPELLPLDLQAELHLRSDRTAIAYRRWVSTLGLSFGTA